MVGSCEGNDSFPCTEKEAVSAVVSRLKARRVLRALMACSAALQVVGLRGDGATELGP